MALLLAPFFMPLFLIRWLFPADEERELDEQEAEREQQFEETWGQMFSRERELSEPQSPE